MAARRMRLSGRVYPHARRPDRGRRVHCGSRAYRYDLDDQRDELYRARRLCDGIRRRPLLPRKLRQ